MILLDIVISYSIVASVAYPTIKALSDKESGYRLDVAICLFIIRMVFAWIFIPIEFFKGLFNILRGRYE